MSVGLLTLFFRKSSVQRVEENMAADQAGPPKKPTRFFFFSFWGFFLLVLVEFHEAEAGVPPLSCIIK